MINTWQNLPKSQEDSEKIEEAIQRMIEEHSVDPTAHLGVGGSLKTHKESTTVDHKANSFVADKISDSQYFYRSSHLPMQGINTAMGYVSPNFPNSFFEVGPGDETFHKSSFGCLLNSDWLDYSKEIIFGFVAYKIPTSDVDFAIFCGNYEDGMVEDFDFENGFGFWKDGGNLYAFYCSSVGIEKEWCADIDTSETHMYRAEVSPTDGEINYKIDGDIVATISLTDVPDPCSSNLLEVIMMNHETFAGHISVGDFFLSIG